MRHQKQEGKINMASGDKRNLYGVAVTVAYIRSYSYGSSIAMRMCQGIAKGFGMSETDGTNIFAYFRDESHPEAITSFSIAPYSSYETEIKSIIVDYGLNLDDNANTLLAIAAEAMIFAYSINSSIELSDFQKLIGSVLQAVGNTVLDRKVFNSIPGEIDETGAREVIVITPFLDTSLMQRLLDYDYSITLSALSQYSKVIDAQLVNYNWYDTSKVLHGPDWQVMKDIENQYYYVSGVLQYESMLGSLDACIEDTTTISTWTGDVTFSYIRNPPCRRADSYIGPVNYVTFNRIFNDGPASSGYFDTGIEQFYIENDRAVLETGDWASNSHILSGVTGEILTSANVFTDANGRYDLLSGEYNAIPRTYSCNVPYQLMHIGNNYPRITCSPPPASCSTCATGNLTGFKYASLEVPLEDWSFDLQFRQTNPLSETGRIYKRAWAVSDNPYIATANGEYLWPYTYTVSPYKEYWYCGPPALNGYNELCQLGFFQTFYNPTFGMSPSLVIYPTLAFGNGEPSEGAGSSRTYSMGSDFLFSGQSSRVPLDFYTVISANLSGKDITTQKFFGMGNAFSGRYDLNITEEENAGFRYSGFSVFSGGETIDAHALLDLFTGKIIGQYKTMKYISGYRRILDGREFEPGNRYAIDSSGNYYTYAYFDSGEAPFTVKTHGWDYWCPVPDVFESGGFERVYADQTVESYFPRFYDGPFSVETRTFLYPNARGADTRYQGKVHGIPRSVSFRVNVREETVRELYGKYVIYPDGGIDSEPEYRPVIRSDVMGQRTSNPRMTRLFIPNDTTAWHDYNFNNWEVDYSWEETGRYFSTSASIGEWVDNTWAPLISGVWVPINRNNVTYWGAPSAETIFRRGFKRTRDAQKHMVAQNGGKYTEFYSDKPTDDGLFHAYRGTSLTGKLTYVLPLFDLSSNSLVLNQGYKEAFATVMDTLAKVYFTSENGRETLISSGVDSMFLEFMGGRSGVTAQSQGGYHTHDFVGDHWNGTIYKEIGITSLRCWGGGDYHPEYIWRSPYYDEIFMTFNGTTSGMDIWCNGFRYNPMYLKRPTGGLPSTVQIPYETDDTRGTLTTSVSGQFLNFSLHPFFVPRARTGLLYTNDEWYYESGLFIGPFDRDVEVGIVAGQRVFAMSDLYVNDEQMSHYFYENVDCDRQFGVSIGRGRLLETNQPFYNKRKADYSIITVIPSGQRAKFNVLSKLPTPPEGGYESLTEEQLYWWTYGYSLDDDAMDWLGLSGETILSLRTHKPLYGDTYDSNIHSGDYGWLDKSYLVGDTFPFKISFPHNGFENLGQSPFEFTTFSRSGKLYPKPDENEFTGLASFDAYGNPTYPEGATVESYWRNYAIKNRQQVVFSGWREGSRVSFEFLDIVVDYDVPPYQSYQLVSPSGNCTLSGRMGYYGQADNCIFTEGVHLVNATPNDEFSEVYNPQFVSDVLTRFTGIGLFSWPTGNDETAPVLKAPSVMLQRENQSVIEEGQRYIYLLRQPPYNYNKLLWPALSDLETMNPGETMEAIPPADGMTFPNSTMMFSASQGQLLPNGLSNPDIVKSYYVKDIFQIYDSVATDAYINSGKCITSGRGTSVWLTQPELSGALVPEGTPLSFIAKGLI